MRYYVRVWDDTVDRVLWEQGAFASILTRTIGEAFRRIREMKAMRSLEDHAFHIVITPEGTPPPRQSSLRSEVQALYEHCEAQSRYNHSRQDPVIYDADYHPSELPSPLQVARDRAWHLGKEEAYTRLAERLRGMKLRYAITGASDDAD